MFNRYLKNKEKNKIKMTTKESTQKNKKITRNLAKPVHGMFSKTAHTKLRKDHRLLDRPLAGA